jgi:hypothetical protein
MDVLVEARKEYLENLYEFMVPAMITSFYSLYLESEKMCKNANNRMIQYQKFLREIKNWSNAIVSENTANIKKECPWLDDLIVAVIVSGVKIMSSIRLHKNSNKISLNTPTACDFVHECYKAAAADLYKNPFVMSELMTDDERETALWERMAECIHSVIKRYVPIQQILAMNISSPSSSEIVIDDEPVEDTEDPDVNEDAPAEEPMEPVGEETEPVSTEPEVETKEVAVAVPQQQTEDDVLFPDASEKKLGTE